jgi:dTDP-4-dehydrorhamnose reductase
MYVIIGASGYFGAYFIKQILAQTSEPILATYHATQPLSEDPRVIWQSLDVGDFSAIDAFCAGLDRSRPLKVIMLSAYHHPDKVEQNPTLAWHLNVTALAYFLEQLGDVHRLYYASSDSVYGESVDGYIFSEDSPLSPVNLYGKHKALAEQIVLTKGYEVLRYSFLIGKSLIARPHFFDVILDSLQKGEGMDMFHDSYRSAIDFNQAADLTVQLAESGKHFGIMNVAGDNHLSKYDVAVLMARRYGLAEGSLRPVSILDTDQSIFAAKRATSTLMNNKKLRQTLEKETIRLSL